MIGVNSSRSDHCGGDALTVMDVYMFVSTLSDPHIVLLLPAGATPLSFTVAPAT